MKLKPGRLRFGEEASLVDHLTELRHRLVICLVALAIGFGVAYAFHAHLIHWLLLALPPDKQKQGLITLSVAEPFLTAIQVSFYAGFIIAMPVILWQIWAFFSPAVQAGSRHTVLAMVVIATILGAAGMVFAYFVALPASLQFLTNYDNNIFHQEFQAKPYIAYSSLVMLAVTVVFEVPIVILGLVWIRVLSYDKLKRNRRLGYVIMAALAVALPGVDPITTIVEMIPLMILFEGSIWASKLLEHRSGRTRVVATGLD